MNWVAVLRSSVAFVRISSNAAKRAFGTIILLTTLCTAGIVDHGDALNSTSS